MDGVEQERGRDYPHSPAKHGSHQDGLEAGDRVEEVCPQTTHEICVVNMNVALLRAMAPIGTPPEGNVTCA